MGLVRAPTYRGELLGFYAILAVLILSRGAESSSKVTIQNHSGYDLWVHCKSGDDLGAHILHDQQHWYWTFHRSIWRNTQFYCWFQARYPTASGESNFHQDFPVWIDGWVVYPTVKCGQCLWIVDTTGFSVWNKATNSFYHAYDWVLDTTAALDTSSSNAFELNTTAFSAAETTSTNFGGVLD